MLTKMLHISALGVVFGLTSCAPEDLATLPPPGSQVGGATGTSPTGGSGQVQNTNSGGSSTSSSGGSSATSAGGTSSTSTPTGGTKATTGGTSSGNTSSTSTPTGGTKATTSGTSSGNTGNTATGGAATGGSKATGGSSSSNTATGGVSTGGTKATGGVPTGGSKAVGGAATGGAATGGAAGATSSPPTDALDCTSIPTMPTGGTVHSGNGQGGKDNLAWQIWSNGGSGSLTTFSTPAFIATWNNSGDYLGRIGFEWGNAGKAYTAYGNITADLAFKKNGTAGQYSYVGIYGWSTNPCIEWYIVDDSYSAMPFNTGTAPSGTFDLDGGTYNLVKRNTTGTGGNRCGNVSAWDQFYSIRKTGRQCGTISVTEHFKAWDAKGWKLGNLLEVKILVEAASGVGSVDFMVANVKKTQ